MATSNDDLCNLSALELADLLNAGETTSVKIVAALQERIALVDAPESAIALRSVLALAPDALEEARRCDDERRAGEVRGPLHGVPILIKDNVEVVGLPSTAGSTALVGRAVEVDAPLVTRLRNAGLIVLGSTNLSQWANMRSPFSTSGWSAVGGLTVNPYRLDRCAGGSSSGSGAALAARLAPLAVGTETDGSITCPASLNGVAGIKPAVGTVSSQGVIPISASQDSPGPMARTIRDVAALYEVLAERTDVVSTVEAGTGDVRVAVATNLMTGHRATDEVFRQAVERARADAMNLFDVAVAQKDAEVDADELTVELCEMFDDLTRNLSRRAGVGPSSLEEVITFENEHADVELTYFGHEYFDQSLATGGRANESYAPARARNLKWAIEVCLSPALADADCLIAPSYSPAWKNDLVLGGSGGARWSDLTQAAAIAGWPIATVPMGLIDGLPVGLSIVGRPGDEPTILAAAAHFERALGLVASGALTPHFIAPQRG
jgi:amidase